MILMRQVVPNLKNTISDLKRRHSSVWRNANITSTRRQICCRESFHLSPLRPARALILLKMHLMCVILCCLECQPDGLSNLFSPLLNEYTQNKELTERLILGTDGQLPDGYKLEVRERLDILNEAGTPIGNIRIGAKNPVDNRSIWKAFRNQLANE